MYVKTRRNHVWHTEAHHFCGYFKKSDSFDHHHLHTLESASTSAFPFDQRQVEQFELNGRTLTLSVGVTEPTCSGWSWKHRNSRSVCLGTSKQGSDPDTSTEAWGLSMQATRRDRGELKPTNTHRHTRAHACVSRRCVNPFQHATHTIWTHTYTHTRQSGSAAAELLNRQDVPSRRCCTRNKH